MNSSALTIVFMSLATISLAGCLNLSKSYPEKRSFVLDVGTPPQETTSSNVMVLKVNKFRISPLFAGRAMVYRTGDLQYESDFYDEWFVAPAILVTQQLHDWLSQAGTFAVLLLGTNHIEPTHVLEGTVTEFYGDFRGPPRAVFGIELQMIDTRNERTLSFRRAYHQDIPLADRSADALAAGLTQALRTVLVTLTKDMAESVSLGRPSGP